MGDGDGQQILRTVLVYIVSLRPSLYCDCRTFDKYFAGLGKPVQPTGFKPLRWSVPVIYVKLDRGGRQQQVFRIILPSSQFFFSLSRGELTVMEGSGAAIGVGAGGQYPRQERGK